MTLISSPVCEQDQSEQLQGCSESGSDVGQGSSTKNPSGSCVFISIEDIGIFQNVQCSSGSIKFHRQRHQLEQGGQTEKDDPHQEQGLGIQEKAQHQSDKREL